MRRPLAQALADSPRTILQTLVETILEVFQAGSAGLSLLTNDEKSFFWPAVADKDVVRRILANIRRTAAWTAPSAGSSSPVAG